MCGHKNIRFEGMFSMIGSYACQDCGLKIEPFVLNALENRPHILFNPKYKKELQESIDRLNPENLKLWNKAIIFSC